MGDQWMSAASPRVGDVIAGTDNSELLTNSQLVHLPAFAGRTRAAG